MSNSGNLFRLDGKLALVSGCRRGIGAAMAEALVTTLYGAVAANLFFLPLAGKLRNRTEEDFLVKSLTIEGLVSMINLENPIVVEQRLQSFLPNVVNL